MALSTKATWICSLIPHCLQRLTVNHVFARADNQNGVRKGELFILWAALNNEVVNISARITSHLDEQA